MTLLDNIKPFWPLLITFVLPRGYSYFKELKTAYRTRPLPKPLPPRVNNSLNILFCAILFFFIQSFRSQDANIFKETRTRIGVTMDILFNRLALHRASGMLTETDEALRHLLTTKDARLIYLLYGPKTLLECTFCHPAQRHTYALYHIPTNVLVPHLIHLLILGLATSGSLTSPNVANLRSRLITPALVLLFADVAINSLFKPELLVNTTQPGPPSVFVILRLARLLGFCAMDAAFAFYIWALSTGRFIFFPFLGDPNANTDLTSLQTQAQQLVAQSTQALTSAQAKLRAYAVASNTVVRDPALKRVEEAYWAEVSRREGTIEINGRMVDVDEEVYATEEVQAAIARVYGSGGVDVPRARREAGAFVNGITQGLD